MEDILIEKVREHGCLYNIKSTNYRDVKIRHIAWEEIAYMICFEAILSRDFCFDTSNFATIVTRPTFVDKTSLIRTFYEQAGQLLITAPHRFGKSTNMNMIKRFFEIQVDEDRINANCEIFKNHTLKVYRDGEFFYQHCGQHPVVYVDFKLLGGDTLDIVFKRFRKVLYDTFRQHGYLLKSTKLNKPLLRQFDVYYNLRKEDFNEEQLIFGLNLLSELLQRHFEKRVYLLIDDYDAPIFDVLFDSDEEKRKTDLFFRNLMSQLLRNNPFFEKVLVHACPRTAGLLFVGYNRIRHFPFLESHGFAEYYGFTESEVEDLVRRHNRTDEMGKIKTTCGEYQVERRGFKVYSAWSVVHYLKQGGLRYREILEEERAEDLEIEDNSE